MSVIRDNSFLIYGDTGDGKTTLIGELAEDRYKKTGKITRLCTADRGGYKSIQPYVDLGIIEVEALDGDPFFWMNKVVRGHVRHNGKWVKEIRDDIGLYTFESMTSMGDALMQALAKKAGEGVNIGGGGNVNFTVSEGGETLKFGGNNMAHYQVVQTNIIEALWESQKLPGWLLWTASAKRDEDPNANGKLLGPAVAGRALTGEVPRWFVYTFRVAAIPASTGKQEKHILYLGDFSDTSAGNAKGLGNCRMPLDAPTFSTVIEPASIVKALEVIDGGYDKAVETIKKRLGNRVPKKVL